MRILITNDDGVHADGLWALAHVLEEFGTVKIVAPDRERSACGHAMTLREPLRVKSTVKSGFEVSEVNGVPVDCVNVGLSVAWPDGCDLVVSGINNGPNLGFDVTYSGTVAGAMEGTINGIKSIAVSMCVFADGAPFHFETGARWLRENLPWLLEKPLGDLSFWNINVPAIAWPEIQGHKFVGMGRRVYEDRVERRDDPWGRPYYWQGGVVVMRNELVGTDVWAVNKGFVSVTPVSLDWTDHPALSSLNQELVSNEKI
ncbi:MAG: 5'/3'-nucleotidase SurE [Chthonomonadaceae bacterium]|nr:5'/3'-nucleotidase SurE [Chthonomonadaceae bacterium]